MAKNIVPYKRRRFSRAVLRKWLEMNGASAIEQVHIQATLQVPEITIEEVESDLREHPNLFHMTPEGRWEAAPKRAFVVYPRKPPARRAEKIAVTKRRGARVSKTKAAEKAPPRKKPKAPPPPSMDPFFVQDERLVSLVFRRDVQDSGQPYESGGHLLVPVPQDSDVSEAVREAIMAACREAGDVQVYEGIEEGGWIFRGTRRLLQASETPDGTKIHLVFAFAPDDDGRQHALTLRAGTSGLLPSGTTRALAVAAPRDAIATTERVPTGIKKLLALPPAPRKADRKSAYRRAKTLLQAAKGDPENDWPKFRDWLIQKKPEFDQELTESILTMALNTGCDAIGAFNLAKMILGDRNPKTTDFARTYCVALASTRKHDAIAWAATLLPRARQPGVLDPDLSGATGRIEMERQNYQAACEAFDEVIADPTTSDDPELIEDYMLAADECVTKKPKRRALEHLDDVVQRCGSATAVNEYRSALQFACDIEESFGARPVDRIEQILQLLVATDEEDAIREYETRFAGEAVKPSEKLRALSVLEDCETPTAVAFLHSALSEVVRATLRQPSSNLISEAIAQLRYVEAAVGDEGHEGSDDFTAQLELRIEQAGLREKTVAAAERKSIDGKVVLLIGGRGPTRGRVTEELKRLGAADVREIPPSWEGHVNEDVIRSKAERSDVVATLTDFMKHDASNIVSELSKAGLEFLLVRTAGGPSKIVRDILTAQ